ncbi:sigma 54-interacting transcriptional regulator [Stenotrophomonas oahuensis]|uniref:Sigma 54-interacting transcriptional regulator n=1 Tax=Stenotrophomonas oahuensis TaxID=3003271 RepID=A0ABY9YN76_9GAMM|nr:sigma 54-interacting transcriptional regulator [Stenotrophomonas sp. A5586]WNH52080.1 sigma 54-interacting transcriptional regulator [Stenotrophomonas sp. A5586]
MSQLSAQDSPDSPQKAGGAGTDALAGYEYQIDVSVWLALDLMLASKLTQEITLEPSTQEDLEADVKEDDSGSVTGTMAIDGYRLVVQAKLRTGDAWTVRGVLALLRHGGERRIPAIDRLADPKIRYLLVTSAGVNGKARGLVVHRAGVWPSPPSMPTSIGRALPPRGAGRVAVIDKVDRERLDSRIRELLTDTFRVPNAYWRQCHHDLREQARQRICGVAGGQWCQADLAEAIRAHQGYIASSPELDDYVYPSQWRQLVTAMAERHAVLIVGQSGTGKTMAARKLYEKLRETTPGLAYVAITQGPHQLAGDETHLPVFYDIEDPWGRYDFDPNSRPWNEDLAKYLGGANANKLIVAASRRDVARESRALDSLRPWVVELEAEHYGPQERERLYRSRIRALPRELQGMAARAEDKVLSELATPLEIQKFFDALPVLDRQLTRSPDRFITLAIGRAHKDSIERTVIEQIGQRKGTRAAVALWALLKANGKISLRALRPIEDALMQRDRAQAEELSPLIGFFVAARNLRQVEDTVTYYHPRVESGIEQVLRHEPASVVRDSLCHLVDALMAVDSPNPGWGARTAARILAGMQRLPDALRPSLSTVAQAGIDAWLISEIPKVGKELEAHLRLAEAAGSANSIVAELARYLFHRPDNSFEALMLWVSPERDDAWYARMCSAPETRPILEAFVRDVLPSIRIHYPANLHRHLQTLTPGLTDAFLDAARKIVHYGFVDTDDAIAAGALEDIESFETIIDIAIAVRTPTDEDRKRYEEQSLAIINGEYNEDYVDYLSNDDDGFTAGEFIATYVRKVRLTGDWRRLSVHRHRHRLLFNWLREIANEPNDSIKNGDELEAVFDAAYTHEHEDLLWQIILQRWDSTYLPRLIERVRDGDAEYGTRCAAITCLIEHAPHALLDLVRMLEGKKDHLRTTGIALELGELLHREANRKGSDARLASVEADLAILSAPLAEIALASVAVKLGRPPSLSRETLKLLVGITGGSVVLRRFRIAVDRHVPLPIDDDIRWMLTHADEDTDASAAIDAAARRGLTDQVQAGLKHRFARVRAHALTAITAAVPEPLPNSILAMARRVSVFLCSGDVGCPVTARLLSTGSG